MKLLKNLVLFSALIPAVSMVAQVNNSTLTGAISDASGAAIPGAVVLVHSVANGLERKATSGGKGEYQISDLPIGAYNVIVTAPGFGTYKSSFVASVGGNATVDVKLTVASQEVQVDVSGSDAGAEVNTTTAEVSQVITPLQLTQLPSLTRNPYDFVALSGNIASDPNGSTQRGLGVSFSGERAASTEILLDGVENTDLFTATVGVSVPLDSIQEYRIITSGFDAQYGRASGGVVNLITRSGTNQFHGSGYEYNRISALAANTYYEDAQLAPGNPNANPQPADHFTQNQFGYSIGGPVLPMLKDKLFFFSNTEWDRVRSTGSAVFAIPTPAFIAGSAANTQAYFAQYGKLASGVTVAANQNPALTAEGLEEVTATAPINAGAGNPTNEWFTSNRVDYRISDKTTTFFRYGSYKDNVFPGTNSLSPYDGFNTGTTDYDQTAVASVDHIFTPNLLSSTKFQFSRVNGGQPLGPAGIVPGLFIGPSSLNDSVINEPTVLPGYLPESPGDAIPFAGPQNLYQIQGDVNWIKGAHSIHVGGGYIQIRDNRTFGAYENSIGIVGDGTSEAGNLAALQAGSLFSYQVAINPGGAYPCVVNNGVTTQTPGCSITLPVGPPSFTHENTFNDGDWYIADTWKVNPRFTLNLGLRWEYYGVQHNTKPNLDTNFYPAATGNLYTSIENGVVEPATQSPIHGLYAKNLKNYAPRVGFAYDLTGDGKTSLRGGYGISYERNFGNVGYNTLFNPPNYGVVDLTAGQNSGPLSMPLRPQRPLTGAAGTSQPLPPVELRALDPHLKTAYASSYNLSVEREVMPNTLVQLAYNGTRGIHQYSIANENKAYMGAVYLGETAPDGTPSTNPLNLQYGSINVREANADSYYNSMNVRVVANNYQKYGLQFTFNYTFAHAMDDLSSTFSESLANDNLGYLNSFNPGLDRGNSDYDVRHRISFGGIYELKLPSFLHANSLEKTMLGGFELAPIANWRTGTPFNIYNLAYYIGYSLDNINPYQGAPYKGHTAKSLGYDNYDYIDVPNSAVNGYHNPTCQCDDYETFTANGSYQNPGLGKDQFFSPNNWNYDMGVYKNFRVKERYNLQFRSEFYNILNHHNIYPDAYGAGYFNGPLPAGSDPNAIATSVGAFKGTQNGYSPTSADERRFVQLAVRLEF